LNRLRKIFGLAMLACLLPLGAGACPTADLGLVKLGEGKLRWFGLPIYTASLWSEPGASLEDIYMRPLLLLIDYDRNISKERILRTTRQEWKRLNGEYPERETAWIESLAKIFPDISAGDQLSTRVTPGGETCFYLGNQPIGRVRDAEFGPAFLSIWLDPNTRSEALRAKLLTKLLQAQAN